MRPSDISVGAGGFTTGGLPLGLEGEGTRKSEPSDPSQPPGEPRGLRPDLVGLLFRFAVVRPGGLPRRAKPRADDAPRLVLAYWRVLFFAACLRCWLLSVSDIFGIIAHMVS
ncbi:MAG: hypothetical protein WAM09_07670 [Anaerolineales bacterium]